MQGSVAPAGWSATQRAPKPFVFRSGGLFGSGTKVRTIRAAVKYMDRHPDDGIYHLRNGTLAQWLEDQEADELAGLARRVATERQTDPRVPLETFLIGTGLVRRPRLALHPRKVRMGYILAGQSSSCDLQVKKGRGRGYLFGRLHSTVPWLSLDPIALSGRPLKVRVGVTTETLPISKAPQEAQITVESNATEEPVAVPVRFRVMGMPSQLNRYLLRPLAGLLAGGFIGAVLGWLLGLSGVGLPVRFPGTRTTVHAGFHRLGYCHRPAVGPSGRDTRAAPAARLACAVHSRTMAPANLDLGDHAGIDRGRGPVVVAASRS